MAFVADSRSRPALVAPAPARRRPFPALSPATSAALMLTGAALLWSGNFLAGRLVADALPPATLSAARWFLALLLLLPFTLRELAGHGREALLRRWPLWVASGILNVAVFTVLIYAGLGHTSLINGSLIGSCAPIVVGLMGWLVLRERTGLRQRLALAVSTAGVALIVLRGDLTHLLALSFNPGDLVLFLGIAAFGLYAVLLKRFPCGLSAAAALAASIPFGLVALAPFAAWELAGATPAAFRDGHAALTALGAVAYVASLPTLGFVLWARGVAVLGPLRAGQFLQLMPVFGAGLAVALLGEHLEPYHGVGLALVVAGLALRERAPQARSA